MPLGASIALIATLDVPLTARDCDKPLPPFVVISAWARQPPWLTLMATVALCGCLMAVMCLSVAA